MRLDTYSSAPVDFAAYEVDPADVIVAGGNRPARALDTSRRKPVARWRFSPPAGYRFVTNEVDAPLGDREGFFVIEARRGAVAEQVWLNRTRLGLLTKESPEGLLLWTVDLGSGRAIRGASVEFLVGLSLITKTSDENGIIAWTQPQRPSFALASFGGSRAFVSILPQAPLPASIVGLRLESAVARAGGTVRFAGFARKRTAGGMKPMSGDVRVVLSAQGKTLASTTEHLDAAGAFASQLAIPDGAAAGDYAILASAGGAVGGTALTVDAASDARLSIAANCPCAAGSDVPFTVTAQRGADPVANLAVTVRVVRTPHVLPPGVSEDVPRWGTTTVYERTVRTDSQGRARIALPAPHDGLASTYGVRAVSPGASATARIVVPSAPFALAVDPDAPSVDPNGAIGILVRGFDAVDGSPRAGLGVHILLAHGTVQQEQNVRLDDNGRAHVVLPRREPRHEPRDRRRDRRGGACARCGLRARRAAARSAAGAERRRLGADRARPTRYRPSDRDAVRAERERARRRRVRHDRRRAHFRVAPRPGERLERRRRSQRSAGRRPRRRGGRPRRGDRSRLRAAFDRRARAAASALARLRPCELRGGGYGEGRRCAMGTLRAAGRPSIRIADARASGSPRSSTMRPRCCASAARRRKRRPRRTWAGTLGLPRGTQRRTTFFSDAGAARGGHEPARARFGGGANARLARRAQRSRYARYRRSRRSADGSSFR